MQENVGATRPRGHQCLSKKISAEFPVVEVECDTSNSGSRSGEEVAELYIRLRGTSTAQPVRALKGFQRIPLGPGEKKTVEFDLPAEAFAIWSDHNEFRVEPASVSVWISPDSASGSAAEMEILP